jgi:serine/threonine-protein phosphatase 2A regulatory subunit A
MKPDHILEHFVPMVNRLAKGDWFSSRTSSCGLFAVVYQRLPSNVKHDFRSTYSQLCHDDTPMVRRAAAGNLGKLAAKVEKEYLKSEVMAMFMALAGDDQVFDLET